MRAILVSLGLSCLAAQAQGNPPRILVDDFEKSTQSWNFVDGAEFPGAKGSLAHDPGAAHGGRASARLQADFNGGGAYVGMWRDLASLQGKDFKEIRLWVKAVNVTRLGVRLADGSGQVHQKNAVALASTAEWQEVVLNVRDFVGGEHWGGANDGLWHGPAKGLGLNLGKDEAKQKTLWIDDVEVVPGAPIEGRPTIMPAVVAPGSCRPEFGVRVTYRWDAEPMGRDYAVFVHGLNAKGHMVFQADHGPTVPTSAWKGRVEYTKTILVPWNAPEGEYRIVVGLYDAEGRRLLKAGAGVTETPGWAYQIGVLKVDAKAPIPKLAAPTLNLDGYKLTFNEEFNDLSVSSRGPGTRWIAHTPYNGDFGDARFADPKDGFPFTIEKGMLRIEARKTEAGWQAGLLSSADPNGNGFSQKFGYFEMRARFPKGPGTWPAFWLMGVQGIKDKSRTNPEIDVVEQYGAIPNALMMTLHGWGPGEKHTAEGDSAIIPGMADDFHTYGVMVEEATIAFYFDGVELWRTKTPEEAKVPLYVMVDLAMGGGWPIDKAVSPSYMFVDHVRAYARR
jgi:hypothetical protein